MHVLITGASGTGTTSLGRALADELKADHIDTDDLFWLPMQPAFRHKRDFAQRNQLLQAALSSSAQTVVSGSVFGWGSAIEDSFGLIVFLRVPTAERLRRLREREMSQRGQVNEGFIAWAAQYDEGGRTGRSLARHQGWLQARRCPVVQLEGVATLARWSAVIRQQLAQLHTQRATGADGGAMR
jgi:uridine kinase